MCNPALLTVIQPTRGVDVGAIDYVNMRLRESRNAGIAVLLISSDLEEMLNLSD
jgi:simple sugar transport system ATP-binding protein